MISIFSCDKIIHRKWKTLEPMPKPLHFIHLFSEPCAKTKFKVVWTQKNIYKNMWWFSLYEINWHMSIWCKKCSALNTYSQDPDIWREKWYFVTKIVLTYCEKKNSTDREKLLKFEAEGREFAKILRSLGQFIRTVKGQNNFW